MLLLLFLLYRILSFIFSLMASYKAFCDVDGKMVEQQINHLRAVADCLEQCIQLNNAQICEDRCIVQMFRAMVPVETSLFSQFLLMFSAGSNILGLLGGCFKGLLKMAAKFAGFL